MTFKNDNDFDKAFRRKVDDTDLLFEEEAWEKMEQKLKKRHRVLFFRNTAAILLLLSLSLSGFYFLNKNDKNLNEFSAVKKIESKNISNNNHQSELTKEKSLGKAKIQVLANDNINATITKNTNKYAQEHFLTNKNPYTDESTSAKLVSTKTINSAEKIKNKELKHPVQETITNKPNQVITEKLPIENTTLISQNDSYKATNDPSIAQENSIKENTSTEKTNSKTGISLTFAFNAGPDFNYTEAFESGKTTLAGGITIGAKITPRFSLKTGVLFGLKNYSASAYNYQMKNPARSSTIMGINANCDVLEIPLKASYTVYSDNKRSIDINTGLSSYLMLKEKYNFQYTPQSGYRDFTLVKSNANQHYLSVANISATYYIKLKNTKYQFGIEPYLKIPLQGVGEGKVHLKSSGVSLNLRYDFNTKNN